MAYCASRSRKWVINRALAELKLSTGMHRVLLAEGNLTWPVKMSRHPNPIGPLIFCSNARFTLADPMPRLASNIVGGKSGRDHPTSRRHPIHILAEWRAMRSFALVGTRESYNIVRLTGWYGEGVLFITTLSCVVHVRLPIGRRPPDEAPTADSGSGTHSHWPSQQHRGVGSANVKRA